MNVWPAPLLCAVALTVACGPGGFGASADDEDTGDSTEVTTTPPPDAPPEPPGTSTSTTGSEATTSDFVPPGDPIPGVGCDPWLQDCPEGEKCVPYGSTGGNWDSNKCVALMGDQGVGEACVYGGTAEATDDCDETSFCFNVDQDGVGTCHAFCTGTPDNPMCPPGSSCILASEGSLTPCIPNCDPILQDCSNEDSACYWTGSQFQCAFTTQDIPAGQPCGYINDCEEGNMCVDALALPTCEGAACCTKFCELDGDDGQCAELPGTSCVAFWTDEPLAGYENVGICIVP